MYLDYKLKCQIIQSGSISFHKIIIGLKQNIFPWYLSNIEM